MPAARMAVAMCALLPMAAASQSLFEHAAPRGDVDDVLGDAGESAGGVRAGSFEVRAAAGVSLGYDSNVQAMPGDGRSATLALGELLMRATNASPTRTVDIDAWWQERRYQDAHDQDASEFGARAGLERWFGGRDSFEAHVGAARAVESRSDLETPLIVLSPYDEYRASVGYGHFFDRLALQARADTARLQYDAAGQDYRDRFRYRGEFGFRYELTGRIAAGATGYFSRDDFDESGALVASADTRGALLGVRYRSADLLQVELAAGYFERRSDDGVERLEGVSARGLLSWRPTPLLRVQTELLRSDAPTRVPGAFAKVRNDARVSVTHSYSRNVTLGAAVRYLRDEFDSLDLTEQAWLGEAACSWSPGRRSLLRIGYEFSLRDDQPDGRDFERQVVRLTWTWRL